MRSENAGFLITAVAMFAIIATVVIYAIKRMGGHPARIAALIIALATLVTAMVPLVGALHAPSAAPRTAEVGR